MKNRINITCEGCKKTHDVQRTGEIPDHVISMGCNWCPSCEDDADDYYEEWYNESDANDSKENVPDDPSQLCMPFIINEIEQNSLVPVHNPSIQ